MGKAVRFGVMGGSMSDGDFVVLGLTVLVQNDLPQLPKALLSL